MLKLFMSVKGIRFCLMGLLLNGLVCSAEAGSKASQDDLSGIRGFNYVPSYARTDVQIWDQYNPDIIDRELAYAARLKLDTVRIFLQELVYRNDPDGFLEKLDNFLTLSAKHNIKVMPVLFDSCFGVSPSMDSAEFWVANPGPDHMGRDYWPLGETYVQAILDRFGEDDRILLWDLMNEPEATWLYRTPRGRDAIWQFCRHFISFVKQNDPNHPVTVGVATCRSNANIVDLIDVVSLHNYGPEKSLRSDIANTKMQAGGKPVIISEVGAPGRNQPYEMSVEVCEDTDIGWFIWELMIGRNQFQSVQGVIYPDGTVRQKSEIEAILGGSTADWVERADSEGIPIAKDHGPGDLIYRVHLRFRQTATDADNFSERYTFFRSISWNAAAAKPASGLLGKSGLEAKNTALQCKQLLDEGEWQAAFAQMDSLIKSTAAVVDALKGKSYMVEPPGLDLSSDAPQREGDPFSWIRGFNYVPSYAVNNVQLWGHYRPDIVERELAFAARLKLNVVRIFLQELVYRNDPDQFLANLEHLLSTCDHFGIKAMPVLFDSCFGVAPSMESKEFWVACPGPERMDPKYWAESENYLRAIVERYRGDRRIVLWDVMNEPEATYLFWTSAGRPKVRNFLHHFASLVKELDPERPITAGFIAPGDHPRILALLDVVSMHNYGPEENLRKHIDEVRKLAAGRPVIISEVGAPGRGQPNDMSVRVCNDKNIGWFIWELMIGRNQFQEVQGIVYPDGTVRSKSDITAIAPESADQWVVRPDSEGIPVGGDFGFQGVFAKAYPRIARIPTNRQNFDERHDMFRILTFSVDELAEDLPFDNNPYAGLLGELIPETRRRLRQAKELFDADDARAFSKMDELITSVESRFKMVKTRFMVEPPGLQ